MRNKYLINGGFYIKDELRSFLLYFDYFSHGLTLPKLFSNVYYRRIIHRLLRILIIFAYISNLYKLRYKIVSRTDNALIIINGKGQFGNKVKLVESKGQYKIIKKVFSKKQFLKEKSFYDTYKYNNLNIKLPEYIFHNNNTIEMDFLYLKSFQRLMIDGTYNLKQSISHFATIRDQLKFLYGHNATTVHGDLGACNIYIAGDTYYLIDFSDSHLNTIHYDLYTLLRSIFSSYHYINNSEKSIATYRFNNLLVGKLIELNKSKLLQVERQVISYRENRFSEVYY